ncbi:Cell division control protein 42 like protein [Mycena venus]|uniref:Cell division control protein 42 like protein n=1 Tax=Mycena venus TaxID=2733690 RepID=A0A8H7CSY7_9AGAR|nr:Cell division control protein 42 like protein [Mycena venus]
MSSTIKCVLVGDSGVGKTCLFISYTCEYFPNDYVPAISDAYAPTVMVGDVPYTLAIFDTAGKTDYDHLRPLVYPQSDVFLVCFSVGMPASLENVRDKWFPEAHHFCPGVPCVIAATQIDLRDDEDDFRAVDSGKVMITTAQGEKLARELGAAEYVECSAKTHKGVKDAFDAAVAAALKYSSPVSERKKRQCIVV